MTLQILDRLPLGVIVVDQECSIIMMNCLAKTRLKGDWLSVCCGRLVINDKQLNLQFIALVKFHLESAFLEKKPSLIELPNMEKIWITASNVQYNQRQIILYMEVSLAPAYPASLGMRQQYGLTDAEFRVIEALSSNCHSVNQVADHFQLSKHTVRTQMKVIYNKTGTTSQIELIKMFMADNVNS